MGPAPSLVPPYPPLAPVPDSVKAALAAEALRVNDRYLHEHVEGHGFCPFARGGRLAGETTRYVHHADTAGLDPLLDLFARVAGDPKQVVAQVILPLVEVSPEAWIRFVDELTALGHAHLGRRAVLAFAALHPRLRYNTESAAALVPLFRRAPDPTIQWVRLDAIHAIYEGRDDDTRFVDLADAEAYVKSATPRASLYDRIADANAAEAARLGTARLEAMLAEISEDARRSYERILRDAR
jgi:hypothetical protein